MNTRIEICTKEDESTTVKGGILERLVAQILTVQQFEVTQTVRVTGMEIDVYAKHKITNQVILVECKAHENALPADVITKLLGNIMLRKADACWLVTTGPLSKDAEGTRIEWEQLSVSTATIDNIMIDAVMFGVAQRNSNTIHIIPDSKEALISTLQAIFKKHTVYVEIKKLGLEYFNYSHFAKIFHTIYTDNNINGKTKATYCSKLYNWFVCLGLFEEVQGQTHLISAPSAKSAAFNLDTRSRRGRYQSGGQNLFWGQTSPEKMICAYNLIDSGRTNYNELKSDGYRNAIEALVAARAIRKSGDEVHTICSLPQAFANIEQSDTIVFAKSLLENNPSMKSDEMGIKLEEKFTKKWKSGSRIRYGNAVIVWVKYLAANDHN